MTRESNVLKYFDKTEDKVHFTLCCVKLSYHRNAYPHDLKAQRETSRDRQQVVPHHIIC